MNFKTEKKTTKLIQKTIFQQEIKPGIGNLQDELYQLENKQTNSAKLHANMEAGR